VKFLDQEGLFALDLEDMNSASLVIELIIMKKDKQSPKSTKNVRDKNTHLENQRSPNGIKLYLRHVISPLDSGIPEFLCAFACSFPYE